MRICVCGWYFLEHPKVLEDFKKVNEKYPVSIVSHQTSKEADEILKKSGLDYQIIPNIGLEWGAYDWYLKNKWDGNNNILFMHDDIYIENVSEFDRLAKLTGDQYYIFQDEKEDGGNQHHHGRMILLSAKMLKYMSEDVCECQWTYQKIDKYDNKGAILQGIGPHTGFWFDPYNSRHHSGAPPLIYGIRPDRPQHEKNLYCVYHYNTGIYHFDWQMREYKGAGFDTKHRFYCPGLWIGRRGQFKEKFEDVYYRKDMKDKI